MSACPALERLRMPLPTVFSVLLSLAISCLLVDAECHPCPMSPAMGTGAVKDIEDIEVGDLVWSRDEQTGDCMTTSVRLCVSVR